MFEVSPQVKDSFEKFRSLGEEETEVMANKVLETHGMVVMFAVDEIINCIDDPDSAIELLIEQGKSHARFGDLSEEIFWAIEQPFLYSVKQVLGFKFTEQLNDIYAKTIHFILTIIVSGFRQSLLAKARRSVSDTLFASVSGSLPLAVTALTGRPSRHNKIREEKEDVEFRKDNVANTVSQSIKEVELIDLESNPDHRRSDS
ncbi:hypothetical protein LSH36_126g00025 [Paralvinella palmiformis]|uniref:Globin domain-containing protein n=1 Tax=Paralvinella palmiformis TaxID=53620 RepID=A0AAD9NAB6_9ANNE|nr:hypothetical protein LSH36_126g00025 [Paralvinella palmiformis]